MCFKYRKFYNDQRQATSILDINALEYYGDNHMDAWLRAVKDIVSIATMVTSAKSMTLNAARTTCGSFGTRSTIS